MPEKILTQNSVGGVISVHVKDGKIVKIRPMAIDKSVMHPMKSSHN
jgi:hypothetical protein